MLPLGIQVTAKYSTMTLYKTDGSATQLGTITLDSALLTVNTWNRLTGSWANATSGISLGLNGTGYIVQSDATWNSGGCVRLQEEQNSADKEHDYDWFYMRPTVDWTQYDEPKFTAVSAMETLAGGGHIMMWSNF